MRQRVSGRLWLASCSAGLLSIFVSFYFITGSTLSKDTVGKSTFRAADFLEPIKYLASDELNGRGDGTPELDRAAEYIARTFRKFNLQPLGEDKTFLQHFSITISAKLGAHNSLSIEQAGNRHALTLDTDFRPFSFSSSRALSAPLVFAGYGITAPELNYDDYKGLDAQGKVVIVLRHEPQEHDQQSVFAGKKLTTYSQIVSKIINAKNHGAAGFVLVNDLGNHPDDPDELLPFDKVAGPRDVGIIALQVKQAVVDEWLKNAATDLESLRRAIDRDLSNRSFALDPSMILSIQTDLERIQTPVANVIGYLPGRDSNLKNQYIVIGAHYDHLGRGERHSLAPRQIGMVHHGADDNASGVSGMLQLAREFSKHRDRLKRSIVLGAFAGEELGLLGSDYYTSHSPIPLDQVVAMINLDMIGRVSKNRLYVAGAGTSPNFRHLLEEANKQTGFELSFSSSGYGASDHTSFTKHNIPVLFFFSGLHSDYHKPSDTWDKINASDGARVVSLIYEVVRRLEATPERPLYVRVSEPGPVTGGGSGYGAYLGSVPDFGEIEHGVRFADVRDNSPAAKAGLKGGDILIEFDGKKIDNLYDLTYALRSHQPGDTVVVVVLRDQQKISKTVTLEKRK